MSAIRVLQREEEAAFFEQFEGVVFGVLKRMTIRYDHPEHEDYAQIGRMSLVSAYETYPDDPTDEVNRGAFVSYAFTRIRWAIIDAIRKKTRVQDKEQVWDESFDHTLMDTTSEFTMQVVDDEWLQGILTYLNEAEQRLVIGLCVDQLTMTDMAKAEGASRQTLYKRRKRIQEKLTDVVYQEGSKQ